MNLYFRFRRSQEIADNVSDEFEHISRGGSLSSMTTGSFSSSGQHQVGKYWLISSDYLDKYLPEMFYQLV